MLAVVEEMIGLSDVFDDPEGVAEILRGRVYGLAEAEVRIADGKSVILWLTLAPWPDLAVQEYPVEKVSIWVWSDGEIMAIPHRASDRQWLHRQPTVFGELCLWYPRDPRPLRWEWANGLVEYVTIVHRHLQAEESCRREGFWPSEDTPHGDGPDPHPIRTPEMRRAAQLWRVQ